MPVPSEVWVSVTVPLFAPAVAVFTPTAIELLSEAPAAIRPVVPLPVAAPDTPVAAVTRPSEKPSVAAVLETVIACEAVPPTCWLPRLTGLGATPAEAVR